MASYWHSSKEARMPKKYEVSLDRAERSALEGLVRSGESPARRLHHARVLLKVDDGETDREVADAVEVSARTVERVRRLFATGGLDAALDRKPQPPRPGRRKLDGAAEAKLVMLACSTPPDGRGHWTMQLLADRMVQLKYAGGVSDETVRRCLKKTRSSRG
jgi:transposase